jgi:energy-coupling factor transporter ATP-binding protein EcfA2
VKGLLVTMLVFRVLEPHEVVVITGVRGSGKSTTAKNLAAAQLEAGKRVLYFDVHDEASRQGKKKKHVELGPLRDRVSVDELLADPALLDADDLSLAVVPDSKEADALAEDLRAVAELVEHTGDLVLFLDEVGEYSDDARRTLKKIGTQSRHWGDEGTAVVFIAQRMVLITRSARDMASIIYTGVQTDPDDLRALHKLVVSRLGPEGAEKFVRDVATQPMPGVLEFHRDAPAPKKLKAVNGGDT